jgi:LysM repeat protein
MRLQLGATAPARVKILRFPAAAVLALAAASPIQAQDVRADMPATHTVKAGDTLWDIAKAYLGDPYLWPSIYRLNTDQIEDPHWIYPGEVLRLPGGQPAAGPIAEAPARVPASTVFRPPTLARVNNAAMTEVLPPRVSIGDVISAAYVGPKDGPAGAGKLLFRTDILGIDKERATSNFQPFDKVLMVPPVGSIAAERERFVAYTLGETIEDLGTIVIPTALLQVVRAPRNGEAATVEVLELYGMVDANTRVIALDTTGASATGRPSPYTDSRITTIRALHRDAVLPSMNYQIIFDLAARDGMKIGDEVQVYRARQPEIRDERPAIPEVAIATAQVIRVTPFGTTARITWHEQPAIKVGEHVRLTARMP